MDGIEQYTSYSSNSKPSITTTLGTWLGGGRSNPCASSQVNFSSSKSSFSILKRLLFEPNVLFFLLLGKDNLAPSTSLATYPDLSTLEHVVAPSAKLAATASVGLTFFVLPSPGLETPLLVLVGWLPCQQKARYINKQK